MSPRLILLALCAASAALAGCGKTASLARPAPLWGSETPTGPVTATRQAAAARARADAGRVDRQGEAPQSVIELRNYNGPAQHAAPSSPAVDPTAPPTEAPIPDPTAQQDTTPQ